MTQDISSSFPQYPNAYLILEYIVLVFIDLVLLSFICPGERVIAYPGCHNMHSVHDC